jgi:hypothetical protein
MKNWKIIGTGLLVIVLISSTLIYSGKTNLKSYYSGDAIVYANNIYIASTNTGSLEVFRLDDNSLFLVDKIRPINQRFNRYEDFFDLSFSIEDNKLYVYAVSHYTIYKYQIMINGLKLVNESKNTYWEWYNRINRFGNDIVTVSAKGINIFNFDLQVTDSHSFTNSDSPYNISAGINRFILSVEEEKSALLVFDRETRKTVSQIPLNFKYEKGNRKAYQDSFGHLYVVDDYFAKKFDLNGNLLGHFQHIGHQGFDVAGSGHNHYVYFSNGVGVVQLDQNMELINYRFTTSLGGYAGWAMGLKVLHLNGDKLVIFNNTNILVLDHNLEKIASIEATETDDKLYPLENLFLNLDKNRVYVNHELYVSGGGFRPNEALTINFGRTKTDAEADFRGRFSQIIIVPELKSGRHDIKVEGNDSGLHYSISITVE